MRPRRGAAGARLAAGLTTLADLLFGQGFGSRAECAAQVAAGRVALARAEGGFALCTDPGKPVAAEGTVFQVDGLTWQAEPTLLLMLHKPAGHECSQRPGAWPSVMNLLPPPHRRRGVQPVGRLDQDTTGLLLLTDDGALLHRLTSPRHHVPKVYQARTAQPVTEAQCQALCQGVRLRDDPRPARALACRALGERQLELTLDEGRYHQVKRMLAAVGNPCVGLHRSAFGTLQLPADLPPGQWRRLDAAARAQSLPAPQAGPPIEDGKMRAPDMA